MTPVDEPKPKDPEQHQSANLNQRQNGRESRSPSHAADVNDHQGRRHNHQDEGSPNSCRHAGNKKSQIRNKEVGIRSERADARQPHRPSNLEPCKAPEHRTAIEIRPACFGKMARRFRKAVLAGATDVLLRSSATRELRTSLVRARRADVLRRTTPSQQHAVAGACPNAHAANTGATFVATTSSRLRKMRNTFMLRL